MESKEAALAAIDQEIAHCTRCPLHAGRTHAVPGAGPVDAEIMFVGEAPGFYEDQKGEPFVGRAGQFLNELLAGAKIDRQKVFVSNVIKCRPPGNRDPQPAEVEACRGYLERQIAIIQPEIIVTLGRHSMARAFPSEKISLVHGQPRRVAGQLYFPMYHPAAALHRPSLRETVAEDFNKLRALLDGQLTAQEYQPAPESEQLSFF